MLKKVTVLIILVLTLSLIFVACSPKESKTDSKTKIKIGATIRPHAEILEEAKKILEKDNIELEIVEFTDYVLPNTATADGEVDANYFQHTPHLDKFNQENGDKLVALGAIHYEPMGLYGGKSKSLEDVTDKAQIGIPNDTSNQARALLLLQKIGWIKLAEGVEGLDLTLFDVEENPHNLELVELAAEQLPRSLDDLDYAVINGNFALEANLSVLEDALASEDPESLAAETYANILVTKKGNEDNKALGTLLDVLQGEDIKKFILDKYKGTVQPAK